MLLGIGICILLTFLPFIIYLFNRPEKRSAEILDLYNKMERQKIATMQVFAGLGKLMEVLEHKRKFSWTSKDNKLIVNEMELEKRRGQEPQGGMKC